MGNLDQSIFKGVFFENFLLISHYQTLISIFFLLISFFIIKKLQNRKVSFSIRMLVGLILGLLLGLGIQAINFFPEKPLVWMEQTAVWYGLFGRVFIAFIRMLVIPLVFVSIIKVVIDFASQKNLSKIAFRGVFWLLFTTSIAAFVGIFLATIFKLGQEKGIILSDYKQREYTNLIDTLVNLVPSNIISAMNTENIIGLVIFSVLLGLAANRIEKKTPKSIVFFKNLIDTSYKIVISITMTIIKYMPYAIIALLARTIISQGIPAIIDVSGFILAIYLATFIMLVVHVVIVIFHGFSPFIFVKKSIEVWLLAFSSRSSIGTLPLTISTLVNRMGVNDGTANLVSSLGSTMGMNGCAGFFPAMLTVMVAQMVGIEIDFQFYFMLVVIVVIGSVGIAGIPGTATIAATVVLSGMGMGEYFPLIGMLLAVDPIIDMPRTLANVSGALTSSLVTDKEIGTINLSVFNDVDKKLESE